MPTMHVWRDNFACDELRNGSQWLEMFSFFIRPRKEYCKNTFGNAGFFAPFTLPSAHLSKSKQIREKS